MTNRTHPRSSDGGIASGFDARGDCCAAGPSDLQADARTLPNPFEKLFDAQTSFGFTREPMDKTMILSTVHGQVNRTPRAVHAMWRRALLIQGTPAGGRKTCS
jgi:hypothetical protein